MDAEDRWTWLASGRRGLADLLESLTPAQWETGSLCTQWRVRDVAAHVAMTPTEPRLGAVVPGLIRARGNLWRFGRDVAIAYARAHSPAEIVGILRRDAEARSMPPVTNAANLLLDVCVHTQDIAVPLGIAQPLPTVVGIASFERAWTMGWPWWPQRRLRGLRLVATDAPVDVGQGDLVEGSLAALLLLVTGRTSASVALLEGPGVSSISA